MSSLRPLERRRFLVEGMVQGVGFRPFVYTIAHELNLSGWVGNSNEGVTIEVEGEAERLDAFTTALNTRTPAQAQIHDLCVTPIPVQGSSGFSIKSSEQVTAPSTIILPDLAPCAECLKEMQAPDNRRYGYPFTNCTQCGPRFSIVEGLPYDRPTTTMRTFTMCEECQREYNDPLDRRFHAQPNACPTCGPQLDLLDASGKHIASSSNALSIAVEKLRAGAILALKGVGGFQLIVDAQNEAAIQALRRRKQRPDKPFAIMCPTIGCVQTLCELSELEEQLLRSAAAPIVLLKSKRALSPGIAPGNPYLGVMLPSSPLHHLLMNAVGSPVIATSGNRSGDPICICENRALKDLAGIADLFLVHNRPIAHRVDDSVVRVVSGRQQVLRRARGYASVPIRTQRPIPSALAVGAQQKNTVAIGRGRSIHLSQHIGDLETEESSAAFTDGIAKLKDLYKVAAETVVADAHPGYHSTQYAHTLPIPLQQCQHHLAHVYACMAEHQLNPPLLGFAWDGTGLGLDGMLWGGESFSLDERGTVRRVAHLHPFRLPGADSAIRQPRLTALGALYEVYGPSLFDQTGPLIKTEDASNLFQMLSSGFRAPQCTSVGRLFDAVAAILGFNTEQSFEGQAAMELEFRSESSDTTATYPYHISKDGVIDWRPMIRALYEAAQTQESRAYMAKAFHNTLVDMIVEIATRSGLPRVLLTGGVFQNRVLCEQAIQALRSAGHQPIWNHAIPPNDGGIALGQLYSLTQRGGICA